MHIALTVLQTPSLAAGPLEIVERKGLGHPDTICDALAENLSCALSEYYLSRFGVILHHNVDKALLWGGAARQALGGGEVLAPMEIYIAGRATTQFKGVAVPVDALAIEASRRWFRAHFHALDSENHVRIHPLIRPSSTDLQNLFARPGGSHGPLANDTSIGVGYAPLDDLERVVYAIEQRLNAPETRKLHPAIGEDVKVMGVRDGAAMQVTLACAQVGRYLANLDEYLASKAQVHALALAAAREVTAMPVEIAVNTADGATPDSIYVTVTGTSAEAGDDGQVGRGNRVNGLITPYRPMSLEAVAGKNAVSHVGKLYNVAANLLAQSLVADIGGVREA
ncbi:MAG TPA: methionine adenosyltransferase, partial [Burkholderiales bacterium]|nr:methionine adenosyltransferase [Burkholderiales bacterium]